MSHQIFFISDVPFRHILLNHLLRAKKIQKKRLSALELPVKEWNLGVISVTHPSTPLTPAIERLRKRTDAADASTSTYQPSTIKNTTKMKLALACSAILSGSLVSGFSPSSAFISGSRVAGASNIRNNDSTLSMVLEKPKKLAKIEVLKQNSNHLQYPLDEVSSCMCKIRSILRVFVDKSL